MQVRVAASPHTAEGDKEKQVGVTIVSQSSVVKDTVRLFLNVKINFEGLVINDDFVSFILLQLTSAAMNGDCCKPSFHHTMFCFTVSDPTV